MMRGKSICKVLKALLQPYLSNSHSLITNSPFSLNSPNASSLLHAVSRKKADRKRPNVLIVRFIKLSYRFCYYNCKGWKSLHEQGANLRLFCNWLNAFLLLGDSLICVNYWKTRARFSIYRSYNSKKHRK